MPDLLTALSRGRIGDVVAWTILIGGRIILALFLTAVTVGLAIVLVAGFSQFGFGFILPAALYALVAAGAWVVSCFAWVILE